MSSSKNFSSQQNLSHRPKPICSNHSWENLPNNNWIVNHNGRILLELNYLNCNRAKLPIGAKTAQILQKYSDAHDDSVVKTKHVNLTHDENQNLNFIRNADHKEWVFSSVCSIYDVIQFFFYFIVSVYGYFNEKMNYCWIEKRLRETVVLNLFFFLLKF